MNQFTCETCRFWFEFSREADAEEPDGYFAIGECRRFPPTIVGNVSAFPHSYHDACCGEWDEEPKPVDKSPETAPPPAPVNEDDAPVEPRFTDDSLFLGVA